MSIIDRELAAALKAGTPTSELPMKPLAAQYAEASKKLNTLTKIGSKFAQGLKMIAASGVQGLLMLVVQLLRALEAIDAVQSALKGGGFIFKDQVAQTDDLAARVKGLVKDYRDAGYHNDLDQLINLAREIDQENPEALYGKDALSTFCASVDDDVAKHERECQKLFDKMTEIDQRVTAGAKLIERLRDDHVFLTAAAITSDDARLFMAHQDFEKIGEALDWPIYQLRNHLAIVQGDLKRIKANIIGFMFLDE
jgi:hypothetical protein